MKNDRHYTKRAVKETKQTIYQDYLRNRNINEAIACWSNYLLSLIEALSEALLSGKPAKFCVLALGSLGRLELLPYSDLDLLILLPEQATEMNACKEQGAELIRQLWDLGFNVGNQMGTCAEIEALAKSSLSSISALQDARLILGDDSLYQTLCFITHPSQMWQAKTFLSEKIKEQQKRHLKYSDKTYLLEPNVKECPGGLRDLQTLTLISQRFIGSPPLVTTYQLQGIEESELQEIRQTQKTLLEIRYLLHMIAKRKEERLLFDYQNKLSEIFGFLDDQKDLAIEKFMRRYFSIMKRITELNNITLQFFSEKLSELTLVSVEPYDEHFVLINQFLEAKHKDVFKNNPSQLLNVFLILKNDPNVLGIRSQTIRLLQQSKSLVGKRFRHLPLNSENFLQLISNSSSVYLHLKQMHDYGLLARFIPEFSSIVGQMQYDLFHLYTVDIHSLFVIKNIDEYQLKTCPYPALQELFLSLDKPFLLYLAALFHDLGKGKGGCHSQIGEKLALNFCKRLRLKEEDASLVGWLVRHHLLLSATAQRKNLFDVQTIIDFCQTTKDQRTLDYLYLLTVADIRATNASLWNSWKESLLKTLYLKAKDYLTHQVEYDEPELVNRKQEEALKLISDSLQQQAESLWFQIKNSYFLHESPKRIAEHTNSILKSTEPTTIDFFAGDASGTQQILIYAPFSKQRFYITTTIFNNLRINILEAWVLKLKNGYCLDCYLLFEDKSLTNQQIASTLKKHLTPPATLPKHTKTFLTRHQRLFITPTFISFETLSAKQQTLMIVTTSDRPGILANIAKAFLEQTIEIHHAKILTSGAQVEDSFYISNRLSKPLSEAEQQALKERINKLHQ